MVLQLASTHSFKDLAISDLDGMGSGKVEYSTPQELAAKDLSHQLWIVEDLCNAQTIRKEVLCFILLCSLGLLAKGHSNSGYTTNPTNHQKCY